MKFLAIFSKYLSGISAKRIAVLYFTVWGCGLPCLVIKVCFESLLPPYVFLTLVATTLTALGVLIGRLTSPAFLEWILHKGNMFTAIQYMEEQYNERKQMIDDMQISELEKASLYIESYHRYGREKEQCGALKHGEMKTAHEIILSIWHRPVHTDTSVTFTISTANKTPAINCTCASKIRSTF